MAINFPKSLLVLLKFVCFSMLISCNKEEYYSKNDFEKIKKIDTHFHYFSENPKGAILAQKDNFQLISINLDNQVTDSISYQEKCTLLQMKSFPEQIKWVTAFTLDGFEKADWSNKVIAELGNAFDRGAIGVKVWKNIGMEYKYANGKFIMIDDPKFDLVMKFIEKRDKTLIAHIGEPKNCWLPIEKMTIKGDSSYFAENPKYHMFLHPEYPSYEQQIQSRDNLLAKNPNLKLVGAHLGSLEWDVDQLAKRLDSYPNFGVDMAARIGHLQYQSVRNKKKVRDFLIKYQDRIVYATDSEIDHLSELSAFENHIHDHWLKDWEYFATKNKMKVDDLKEEIEGLQLPKTVIDKIYRENALKYFALK